MAFRSKISKIANCMGRIDGWGSDLACEKDHIVKLSSRATARSGNTGEHWMMGQLKDFVAASEDEAIKELNLGSGGRVNDVKELVLGEHERVGLGGHRRASYQPRRAGTRQC